MLLPTWFLRLLEWRKRPAPKTKRRPGAYVMFGWARGQDAIWRNGTSEVWKSANGDWMRADDGLGEPRTFRTWHDAIGMPLERFPAPLIPAQERVSNTHILAIDADCEQAHD